MCGATGKAEVEADEVLGLNELLILTGSKTSMG